MCVFVFFFRGFSGLCLLLCGGCVCYCVGVVFVVVWGLCLLLSFLFGYSDLIIYFRISW
jgi:hypothetical protein